MWSLSHGVLRIVRAGRYNRLRPACALQWNKRTLSTQRAPLRVCVVGSGPGGFYTAQRLAKVIEDVEIDIFERLPVPYGLVRFGVAPDHPEVKNVIHHFDRLMTENKKVRFLGNVNVGVDVTMGDLRKHYSAVVLAYGADDDKQFGIKGEDAQGVVSARSFVGWYNGAPEHAQLQVDLSKVESVVILGQGNVALDCARLLLAPVSELAKTDVCTHAVRALEKSSIRKVHIVGRRGPMQAAFTIKELREMTKLPDTTVYMTESDIEAAKFGLMQLEKTDRPRKRMTELMMKQSVPAYAAGTDVDKNTKEFHIVFQRSPQEISVQDGVATGVTLQKMKLEGDWRTAKAVPTGETETIDCQLILRSIGYKSLPIKGLPFDIVRGVVPNVGGYVADADDSATSEGSQGGDKLARLYAAGWVKTGPVGVILSTMNAAFETADVIIEDFNSGRLTGKDLPKADSTIDELLGEKKVVSFDDWKRIEAEEIHRGQLLSKPFEKFTSTAEMLQWATAIASNSDTPT